MPSHVKKEVKEESHLPSDSLRFRRPKKETVVKIEPIVKK
jgi:hypothetical protein